MYNSGFGAYPQDDMNMGVNSYFGESDTNFFGDTSNDSFFGEGCGVTGFGNGEFFNESVGFSTDDSDFFTETSSDIFTETKVPVRRIVNSSKSSSSKKDTDNSEKYHTNYEPSPHDYAGFASSAKKALRNVEEKTTTGMLHKNARDERIRAKADDRTAEDYDIEAVRSSNPIDSETYRDLADNARESAARRRQYADSLTKIAKNHSA